MPQAPYHRSSFRHPVPSQARIGVRPSGRKKGNGEQERTVMEGRRQGTRGEEKKHGRGRREDEERYTGTEGKAR